MSLSDKDRATMVRLEIERARKTYKEMVFLMEANLLNGAASRLYYAVFHAVSALLIHDAHYVKSHKGAFVAYCQHYVNTGIMPIETGRLFGQLETMRNNSDYNCIYEADKEELQELMEEKTKQSIHLFINQQNFKTLCKSFYEL